MTSGGTHTHQNLTSGWLYARSYDAKGVGGDGAVFYFQEEGQLGQ